MNYLSSPSCYILIAHRWTPISSHLQEPTVHGLWPKRLVSIYLAHYPSPRRSCSLALRVPNREAFFFFTFFSFISTSEMNKTEDGCGTLLYYDGVHSNLGCNCESRTFPAVNLGASSNAQLFLSILKSLHEDVRVQNVITASSCICIPCGTKGAVVEAMRFFWVIALNSRGI